MSDTLSSLPWDPAGNGPSGLPSVPLPTLPPDSAKSSRAAFCWPTPPFACFPSPTEQTDPLPCTIVGLNNVRTSGRLTFFVPEESVAHVQQPPARTTVPLRFDQFRSLTLVTPLRAQRLLPDDPHAAMLSPTAAVPYRVVLHKGPELQGRTLGHVETAHGLFLFPPVEGSDAVLRTFIPRQAYQRHELGARIGDVLVSQKIATPEQVEEAADMQQQMRSQRLGEILLQRNAVTPEQLVEAIDQQSKLPMVRIGDALVSLGLVTPPQLDLALVQQKQDRNTPLGELLVRMGVVSPADLQTALSRKMGYPLVKVDEFPAEAEALRLLPFNAAMRLLVMPLLLRDGKLIVAIDDPARRRAAVDEVEFIAQTKVVPVLAQSLSMEAALQTAYEKIGAAQGPKFTLDTGAGMNFETDESDKLLLSLEKDETERSGFEDERPIEQSDNSLVRLINSMIIEAHKDGVSDIHIESYPGREKIRIRFRKDGLLRTYLELPPNYRNALVARIKIMCDLDISERRKPQDGKINFAKFSSQHKIELRVAAIPTNNGLEDVVMRILASAKPIPLDRVGLSPRNLEQLKLAVERPYGMVLCVGPTGSGKTTTLHSALSHINVPERKIWTAEDPVEITQPGLRQVQVNPKIDWTFAKALRAFLRADPDVIMVGEIRDSETAHMAVEASLTGHLVLSTLHTNSAPETVTRLLDMGMDPFNFADSLLAVLAQRLVRRLCNHCRESRPATTEEVNELLDDHLHAFGKGEPPESREDALAGWVQHHGREGRLMAYRSAGCKECNNTGFKGRLGLHELMPVSRDLRHLIQTGSRAEDLQRCAMQEGMRSLRQDGIVKVLQGLTTIEEVRSTSNV